MLPVGVLATAGLLLPALARAAPDPDAPTLVRQPGRCAMRDSCGRKGAFGGEIPCPDNGPATVVRPPFHRTSTLPPSLTLCSEVGRIVAHSMTTTLCTPPQSPRSAETTSRPRPAALKARSRLSRPRSPRQSPSLPAARPSEIDLRPLKHTGLTLATSRRSRMQEQLPPLLLRVHLLARPVPLPRRHRDPDPPVL